MTQLRYWKSSTHLYLRPELPIFATLLRNLRLKNLLFLLLAFTGLHLSAQITPRFEQKLLDNPKQYSVQLEKLFRTIETKKVSAKTQKSTFALENGYAKYDISNAEKWLDLRDQVKVKEIHIVYSKYPKDAQFWLTNYHELLANRLKSLFEVDPELNDNSIKWMLVLQTDCETQEEAQKLFHGILLKYDKLTPKEIQERQKKREAEEQQPGKPNYTSAKLKVNRYMKSAGGMLDSSVYKAFERNKQWKDVLVVIDWTSSMYQYSAQCLAWHLDNVDTSGIRYFAFFNDGDAKWETDKKIGETGGIYFGTSDNMDKVVRVFNTAMRKGLGGEMPENDMEAVVRSIEKYPDFHELVLVADNSMVRDFDLVNEVKHPIRVILADADEYAVNPQYINLAFISGGSLHTGKQDIYFDQIDMQQDLVIFGHEFTLDKGLNLFVCKDKEKCRYIDQEMAAREKKNLEELKNKPLYRTMHKDKTRKKGFFAWVGRLFGKS